MRFVRVALFIVGICGAIWGPWWMPAACIVLLCVRFPAWEAIVIGAFVDLLWLSPHASLYSVWGWPLFTIGAIAAAWVFEPIRREFLLE